MMSGVHSVKKTEWSELIIQKQGRPDLPTKATSSKSKIQAMLTIYQHFQIIDLQTYFGFVTP